MTSVLKLLIIPFAKYILKMILLLTEQRPRGICCRECPPFWVFIVNHIILTETPHISSKNSTPGDWAEVISVYPICLPGYCICYEVSQSLESKFVAKGPLCCWLKLKATPTTKHCKQYSMWWGHFVMLLLRQSSRQWDVLFHFLLHNSQTDDLSPCIIRVRWSLSSEHQLRKWKSMAVTVNLWKGLVTSHWNLAKNCN